MRNKVRQPPIQAAQVPRCMRRIRGATTHEAMAIEYAAVVEMVTRYYQHYLSLLPPKPDPLDSLL